MQDIFIISDLSGDDKFNIFYMLFLLVLIGSSVIVRFRNKPLRFFKGMLIWIAIILGLVLLSSYHNNLIDLKDRLMGELNPSRAASNDDGSISFRMSEDGHYHIQAEVNGHSVDFLLDTGASDVVLSLKTAERIGINIKDLRFTKTYNTANGKISGAPVILDTITTGTITMHGVTASVNNSELEKPLLGMSFLTKLKGYEVRDGVLTLWQ